MSNFREKDSIIKHSAIISAVGLLGKILGFVKQAVIAWAFGSNGVTDIYFAADGYTSMFGEIMRTSVAPTVLTRYVKLNEEGQNEKGKKLIQECFLFFGLIGIVLVAINILLAHAICNIIGISYTDAQKSELVFFLRALCPVMLFTSIAGVAQGYLDAHKRFVPAKLCSFFFSFSIIVSVILFRNFLGLRSLLYGFIFGYALHTIFIISLVLTRTGVLWKNPLRDVEFQLTLRKFVPLLVGNSVVDLGHLIDKIVASSLVVGSVSSLYYGQVISNDIVNSVIITSVGTVLLTSLTKKVALKNDTKDKDILGHIQSIMCTMTIIAGLMTILYAVEGKDLIRFFFQRGSFNSDNTISVAEVATCYAIGFIFMANREVLIKTHYAYQDTFTPMINSIIGVVFNLTASVILSRFLGVAGIALATSLSMVLVCSISYVTVKKHLGEYPFNKLTVIDLLKVIIALIITVLIGKELASLADSWHFLIRMCGISISMCIVYIISLLAFKERIVIDYVLLKVKKVFSGE